MDATLTTEFSIYLADRPGELAGILEAAEAAGIEVTAVCVGDHNSRGLIRMLAEPEDALRNLLESLVEAGAGPFVESQVIVCTSDHRPRLLRDLAAKLALGGINVSHAYHAPAVNGTPSRVVLCVSDPAAGIETVRNIA